MLTYLFQTLAMGIGTVAFCVFFRVPKKYFPDCGLVGSLEWAVILLVNHLLNHKIAAIFCGALTVILLSRCFAVKRKCPLSMFLIPGIFPMVPGTAIYHMTYAAANGDYFVAIRYCMDAIEIAFVIAIAIAIGLRMPARLFQILSDRKSG